LRQTWVAVDCSNIHRDTLSMIRITM